MDEMAGNCLINLTNLGIIGQGVYESQGGLKMGPLLDSSRCIKLCFIGILCSIGTGLVWHPLERPHTKLKRLDIKLLGSFSVRKETFLPTHESTH